MTTKTAPRPYQRVQRRVPLDAGFPMLFTDDIAIGEGQVTNLTSFGCTVECPTIVMTEGPLSVRLLLPDQHAALPIDVASVRWADGRTMGLEFIQIDPAAHLRLQYFVWDLMLERIFSRIRENSSVPVQANSEVEHHPAV